MFFLLFNTIQPFSIKFDIGYGILIKVTVKYYENSQLALVPFAHLFGIYRPTLRHSTLERANSKTNQCNSARRTYALKSCSNRKNETCINASARKDNV